MTRTRRGRREARRLRFRRIQALLAGGLVLGVGAAATLAAWNDTEHGSATFTAGRLGRLGLLAARSGAGSSSERRERGVGMRAARVLAGAAVVAALLSPTPAWAAPATEVVQGDVLRLVSVADWDAASRLVPGRPVHWDVTVSADAPDPGTVLIGVSAAGDAALTVAVHRCEAAWGISGCPAGALPIRTEWRVPLDGAEVPLTRIRDDEVARLRLTVALVSGSGGSTRLRVHAHGAGESAAIAPGGDLAVTGPPPLAPWALGGGALLLAGLALLVLRRPDRGGRS
ncbi:MULTISPECIES: SipW-dependent-type signal peptide-containing protein [Microbacterium]|uniref:SipW-dependent-type signal peptide-containing protein n=1 Tax=Microbacterium TaxID=33882 RepID=UPI00234BDC46|nr:MULTISPECIES: SipW-dependent-type signal peptide-containing protein [Microbacterium]UWF76726.1 hypothetical protein JSY13_07590 [Microbacterium neungamense]WCM54876.1 hypothetical protein JRG78_07590 [Microbacterium sp. EF45047]